MLSGKNKKVLILAPHTDDGEFGCGGTIAKLIQEGADVYYAALSACEESVPPQFPKDILTTEVKAATQVLGIPANNLSIFHYQVRRFSYRRQEILDTFIDLRKRIQPDLVFIPSMTDVHQDHHTVSQEAVRAFKFCSILSYELPWNNLTFNATCFVSLTSQHVDAKVNALAQYRSQQHRPYANEEFIRSLARVRGVQISTPYAETFEVVRWIVS